MSAGDLDLKKVRRAWLDELEPALRRNESGLALSAALCERWNALLLEVYRGQLSDHAARCGLFALGGYGRCEMAPFSDVDLMVLVPDGAEQALLDGVQSFIQTLWAAGVKLGHSVRTLEQCLKMAAEDTSVATSLLGARLLAGDPEQLGTLQREVRAVLLREGPAPMLRLIREGVRQRRLKFGDSAYLLEPQLKMGRGGLRDLQAVWWAATLLFGTDDLTALVAARRVSEDEARRLDAARSFLLKTRFALHVHHGWKQDQLTYAAQGPVATMLGFGEAHAESLNRFMKAYYFHARDVASLSDLWLEEWAMGVAEPDGRAGAWLTVERPERLVDEPSTVLEVLDRARRERLRLHPAVRRVLGRAGAQLPVSVALDERANTALRHIVCDLDDPHDLLQAVADSGILGAVVPEWAHLEGQAQHDTYHVYTTDVHLLITCRRLKQLFRGELVERSQYLSSLAHRYTGQHDPAALLLAALLHDVGKGLSGDHSIIGAGLAGEVARRMGFGADDQQLVRLLVIEHLTMPKVSQRRDLRDPSTLRAFTRNVWSPALLDGLALLSFVDMDSVGPGHLSDWKLRLLEQLHRAATAWLKRSGSEEPAEVPQPYERLRALLRDELGEGPLERQLERLPTRLAEAASLPQLVRCVRLLAETREGQPCVAFHDSDDATFTEVLLFEPEHPGRLAEVAAMLAAAGLDIHKAASHPLRGGGTLDLFDVRTADPAQVAIPQRRQQAIGADIQAVLLGELRLEDAVARKLGQSRLPPRKRPDVRQSVMLDNEFDPAFTIVEVKAPDAPGLLALVARCLSELSLQVDRSIISTEGDRAIDTFYVIDQTGQKLDDARAAAARQRILAELERVAEGWRT